MRVLRDPALAATLEDEALRALVAQRFVEIADELGKAKTQEEHDALIEERTDLYEQYSKESDNDFTTGHWETPNVLAHVRFNERTGPNGERVLFIEEIQSDWAQEGKKKGFVGAEGDRKSVV